MLPKLGRTDPEVHLRQFLKGRHLGSRRLDEKPPTVSIFNNGWWSEPTDAESITDPRAAKLLLDLQADGVPIRQAYLKHETTNLLPAPVTQKVTQESRKTTERALKALGVAAGAAATVATAVGTAMGIGAVVLASLVLVALDPALCVELSDGTVWEIYTWEHLS